VPTVEEIQKPDKTIFEGYLVTQTFKLADFFAIDGTVQYASGQRYYSSHLFRNDLYIVNHMGCVTFHCSKFQNLYYKAVEV
jgi:hypothetical protein